MRPSNPKRSLVNYSPLQSPVARPMALLFSALMVENANINHASHGGGKAARIRTCCDGVAQPVFYKLRREISGEEPTFAASTQRAVRLDECPNSMSSTKSITWSVVVRPFRCRRWDDHPRPDPSAQGREGKQGSIGPICEELTRSPAARRTNVLIKRPTPSELDGWPRSSRPSLVDRAPGMP